VKVFVAGATGVLGRQLVPELVRAGHDMVGMTRTDTKRDLLAELGAQPVVADALNPEAVGRAVREAAPEVIVHQLTAIPPSSDMRRMERDFATTNRLRTEGTDHLLAAGRAVGVRRFVAQSFWGYLERSGDWVKSEDDPLDPNPPEGARTTVDAIRHLEARVAGSEAPEGVVLRYGMFYGPGTSLGTDPPGAIIELIRKRRFPVVGGGTGVWSFIHVADAATATAAALTRAAPGIYHIADDEPAAAREWLPYMAVEGLGAKPPLRLPRWLGRLAAGEVATVIMTEARGVSNTKARRELGWEPAYATWRHGFVEGLG
jgi:nucleoside-diphosphate-sugar epimerase